MLFLYPIPIASLFLLILGCGGYGKSAGSEEGSSWPRWRGSDGNGISQETGWNPQALAGGPRVLWKADVGVGYSNMAIAGNRLYTMGWKGDDNSVICLDPDKGTKIWKYSFPSIENPQSTPTIVGSSVYALSKDGILLCLNSKNGKLRWKKDLVEEYGAVKPHYGFAGSPVVEGDLSILTANSSGIALNRETGNLVWASEKPPKDYPAFDKPTCKGTYYSTPVVYESSGKNFALLAGWKGICSVDVETGRASWLYEWGPFGWLEVPDPVMIGSSTFLIFAFSESAEKQSVLMEIEGEAAKVLWKSPQLHSTVSTPVVVDGYIYGCYGGPAPDYGYASLRCVDLNMGKLMWEQRIAGSRGTDLICVTAANGLLIILNDQGKLFVAESNPNGYREIVSCDVLEGKKQSRKFFTPPVLCNGRIYCRNYAGDLVCIDVRQ